MKPVHIKVSGPQGEIYFSLDSDNPLCPLPVGEFLSLSIAKEEERVAMREFFKSLDRTLVADPQKKYLIYEDVIQAMNKVDEMEKRGSES